MSGRTPLVSVGVPVFNGERYLRGALESIVAQDYPNLEIIISDNCSEDGTADICRELATRDRRIRYTRTNENIGAIRNFNRVFQLSTGDFFAWAAYDDRWAPTYFRRCAEVLIAHPEAVLAHTGAEYIDANGNVFAHAPDNPLAEPTTMRQRFHAVMLDPWWGLAVYGLIRANAMRQTRLVRDMMGGDKVFLAELTFHGTAIQVPERLWSYRMKPYDQSYVAQLKRALFVKKRLGAELVPYANLCKEYLRLAAKAPTSVQERALMAADVLYWYSVNATMLPIVQRTAHAVLGDRYDTLREHIRKQAWFRRVRHIPEPPADFE